MPIKRPEDQVAQARAQLRKNAQKIDELRNAKRTLESRTFNLEVQIMELNQQIEALEKENAELKKPKPKRKAKPKEPELKPPAKIEERE